MPQKIILKKCLTIYVYVNPMFGELETNQKIVHRYDGRSVRCSNFAVLAQLGCYIPTYKKNDRIWLKHSYLDKLSGRIVLLSIFLQFFVSCYKQAGCTFFSHWLTIRVDLFTQNMPCFLKDSLRMYHSTLCYWVTSWQIV